MDVATEQSIPVFLVTGFLGSGKTTLISALLKQPGMEGTAVVVNEFGAVGIDDAIFTETIDPENVRLLANGCLCCAAGDDLGGTIRDLADREYDRPRRIVVETSGLADPVPVLIRLMTEMRMQEVIKPGGVIATIDAVNGLGTLDSHPVASRQAAVADRRIVTKADLVMSEAVGALAARLRGLNPGAPIDIVSNGNTDSEDLFGATSFDPFSEHADPDRWLALESYRAEPLHQRAKKLAFAARNDIGTWLIEEPRDVDWSVLSPLLAGIVGRYGDVMLRLKGIVHTTGDSRPLVLHSIQRLFHAPVRLDRSTSRGRTSSIVIIGESCAAAAVEPIAEALECAARAS